MVKRVMKLSQSGRATRYRSFSECDLFSQSCAAADKVSTDVERRAIPLRQLRFTAPINDSRDAEMSHVDHRLKWKEERHMRRQFTPLSQQ